MKCFEYPEFYYCKSYIFLEQSEKTKGSSADLMAFSTLQSLHDASLGEIPLSGREEQYLMDQVHICIWLSINTNWNTCVQSMTFPNFIGWPCHPFVLVCGFTLLLYLCILEGWTVGDNFYYSPHVLGISAFMQTFQNLELLFQPVFSIFNTTLLRDREML